jgi:hypothetical protein
MILISLSIEKCVFYGSFGATALPSDLHSHLRWGVVNPTPNTQTGGPPLVFRPRLLFLYIRS